jgi:hypothetical protein
MSTTVIHERFITLPDADSLQASVVALEEHGFSVEVGDARAQAAYGQHSQVGKILEIHQELPGRIDIVLSRQPIGF